MGNKDWETPEGFYDRVNVAYGPFTFDAAASESNSKCLAWADEQCDGLAQPWCEWDKVWVNPPYCDLGEWVGKALFEQSRGAYVVMLLPWSQWAAWMEEVVRNAEVVRVVGRIKFIDPENRGRTQPNGQNILAIFRPPISGVTWPVGFCGGKINAG